MKANLEQLNLKTYQDMTRYINKLGLLEVHKRTLKMKIYNLYLNLNNKQQNLKQFVINPKKFCDEMASEYKQNTPIHLTYLESIKNLFLIICVLGIAVDFLTDIHRLSQYFIYILLGCIPITIILKYLAIREAAFGDFEKERTIYKVITTIISVILILPIVLFRNKLKSDMGIDIIAMQGICVVGFVFIYIYINYYKNKINEKTS